jgi:hypothetical protein
MSIYFISKSSGFIDVHNKPNPNITDNNNVIVIIVQAKVDITNKPFNIFSMFIITSDVELMVLGYLLGTRGTPYNNLHISSCLVF